MNAIELSPGTATSEGSDAARRVMAMRRFPRRAVRLAIEYIQANLAQDVRLEDMAGVASLSIFISRASSRKRREWRRTAI